MGKTAITLAAALVAASAHAQTLRPATRSTPTPGVLTAYDFHLNAAAFATDDERFGWDADFGGDIDLADYRKGRVNFLANYEVILGSELRALDPNQGTYTLDLSASLRWRRIELAGVFHHVSRHLIDRAKRRPIDWNMVGVGAARRFTAAGWEFDTAARALWTTKRSSVDYDFEASGDAAAERSLGGRWRAIAGAALLASSTEGEPSRGTLWGSWAEIGLRLKGPGGALDLFLAHERRVDADPLDREPRSWALAGFRLRGR